MRLILILLVLLGSSWTVGAQKEPPHFIDHCVLSYYINEVRHAKPSYAYYDLAYFLDSLYRANRDKQIVQDSIAYSDYLKWRPHLRYVKKQEASIDATLEMKYDTTIYIRETIPLDSVPIVKCDTLVHHHSFSNHWTETEKFPIVCDTLGWRITKDSVIEIRK